MSDQCCWVAQSHEERGGAETSARKRRGKRQVRLTFA